VEINYLKAIIDLWGVKVLEPVTSFTDIGLFFLSLFLGLALIKTIPKKDNHRLWIWFIWGTTLPAIIGAVNHGLYLYVYPYPYIPLWIILYISVIFGFFAGELACLRLYLKPKRIKRWEMIFFLKFCLTALLIIIFKHDMVHKMNIVVSVLFIVLSMSINFKRIGKGGRFIIFGLLITMIGGAFQSQKISIHPLWFNFNDIAHLTIITSLIMIYVGIKKSVRELP